MSDDAPLLILKKRLKLQSSTGDTFISTLHGLEHQNPYTLTLILSGDTTEDGRIDILKHELANELTSWLSGKSLVGDPALVIPKRIDEAMLNFLKFGRPPNQADIYLWILSRTLVTWKDNGGMMLIFGQVSSDGTISDQLNIQYSNHRTSSGTEHHHTVKSNSLARPSSAPPRQRPSFTDGSSSDDVHRTGNFKLTQEILGTSGAMSQLHTKKIIGRVSARPTFVRIGWTDDHYRLTNDITTRRHEIEDVIEQRRRVLEVSKARKLKTTKTYRTIREKNVAKRSDFNWAKEASYEVTNLDRITATINEDIQRQKCRTERTTEHIRWTMAPNGFANRRGRSSKGPLLGSGPLPAAATSGLKDIRLEQTLQSYHWDQHGRRQLRRPEDITPGSDIERALNLLKKAATNSSMYKLDLRKVFQEIDKSGDGFVSLPEMNEFFTAVGLKMASRFIHALFRHFDPNESGSIHYGEFCWAFFNRRSLVSQWKQNTKTLNDRQIKAKMQLADRNGNGILSRKEFSKLLKSFSIKLSDMEVGLLVDRFDKDGDGELDLAEFTAFIDSEINAKMGDTRTPSISRQTKTNVSSNVGIRSNKCATNADEGKCNDLKGFEEPPSFEDNDDVDDSWAENSRTASTRLPSHSAARTLDDTAQTSIADYALSGPTKLTDIVNPSELSLIFAQQAKIEAKLGDKYYK